MNDNCRPLVPSSDRSSLSSSEKLYSWNFDDLSNDDESNSSSDFFSVLEKRVARHVYLDEDVKYDNCLSNSPSERSTIHIDSSDLISRCKRFLPLITDANRQLFSKIESGENVRIELDSDQDNEDDERTIEMNLIFCPNADLSSECENTSEESDDENRTKSMQLPLFRKKSQVNIIEIQSTSNMEQHDKSEKIVDN